MKPTDHHFDESSDLKFLELKYLSVVVSIELGDLLGEYAAETVKDKIRRYLADKMIFVNEINLRPIGVTKDGELILEVPFRHSDRRVLSEEEKYTLDTKVFVSRDGETFVKGTIVDIVNTPLKESFVVRLDEPCKYWLANGLIGARVTVLKSLSSRHLMLRDSDDGDF